MIDSVDLMARGLRSRIAAHLVTRQDYLTFLRADGRPAPAPSGRSGSLSDPVTQISQTEAAAYCRWLGRQEGQDYRLPVMAELVALSRTATLEGISQDVWSRGDVEGFWLGQTGHETSCCEWTGDLETVPQFGVRPDLLLAVIFYPPWLRRGSNAVHMRARLDPSQGYSFVSFRIAYTAA